MYFIVLNRRRGRKYLHITNSAYKCFLVVMSVIGIQGIFFICFTVSTALILVKSTLAHSINQCLKTPEELGEQTGFLLFPINL